MKFLTSIVLNCSGKTIPRGLTTKVNEILQSSSKQDDTVKKSKKHETKLDRYINSIFYLKDIKQSIPNKHFITRKQVIQHLYLIDQKIAKDVAKKVLPYLRCEDPHLVCETNPGLGLITTELLRQGVELIRLYESCSEFRLILKNLSKLFPERIELFTKDIFHIGTLSYADRYDSGYRVKEMLKGVPVKPWDKDPVMTIIGTMPNSNFIRYLMRMIVLQQEIVMHGRVQVFALTQPNIYEMLESTPDFKPSSYKFNSVLFQLLFNCKLLGKYARQSFLPWESSKINNYSENDFMYLIKIVGKETPPVATEHLLYLYYFVKEAFRKQKRKLIPTMEKWLPGIGVDLILSKHKNTFQGMSIYTEFGELHPKEIIHLFQLMVNHPEFKSSPFLALIDSQLLKDETVETDSFIDNNKTLDDDDDDDNKEED